MPRPTPDTISSGLSGWDASVRQNFSLVFSTPMPPASYANFAALPAAGSYADCVAVLADEHVLVFSDGTNWHRMGRRGAAVTDSVAADVAALRTDLNGLLAVLRAAKLIAP